MLRQRLGLAFLLLVAATDPVRAQEQTAAVEGTVRDAHGGGVPGATVRIEAATGLALESVSDRAGVYRFAALSPGRYALEAHLTAFAPARVEGIDLRLGQLLTIDD